MIHSTPFEDSDFVTLFAKLRRPVVSKVASKIIELASIRNGESLLDLGCGPGLVAKSIIRRRTLRYALLIDRSQEMVETARRNIAGSKSICEAKQVDLDNDDLKQVIGSNLKFDHIIAIDLWHLLANRRRVAKFLQESLFPSGKLTLALHKEISSKALGTWHAVRSEIREKIANKLGSKYPDFQFPERSRGAIAHRDEISLYLSELSKLGFNLKKSVEDSNLADINQMSRHLPESFRIEVKREFPRIPDLLLKRVVGVSVKEVLNKYQGFEDSRVATEVFSVFERA